MAERLDARISVEHIRRTPGTLAVRHEKGLVLGVMVNRPDLESEI